MSENTNECAIAWRRGDDCAEVTAYTHSRLKSRIEELAKRFPNEVQILARNKDGSIFAHIPNSYVKVNPPRQYSEETLQKTSERAKSMHAERNKAVAEEPFCV